MQFLYAIVMLLVLDANAKIIDTSEHVEKLSEANIEFTLNLYKNLIEGDPMKNVMFSPVSISAALAMTHLGAKGKTAKQIDDAFMFSKIEDGRFHSAFGELHGLLFDKASDNVTVKSSNRVFADKKRKVLEDYKNALTVYGAKLENVDFKTPSNAVKQINDWASDATNGKISNMLQDDAVDSNTALIVANAVYFRGDWHSKFNEMQTERRAFYVSHYKIVETPFMFQRGHFKYAYISELTLQVLEMDYAGKDYSMVLLMPENFDLAKVEANLNHANLTNWLSALKYKSVDLSVPKFKLEETLQLQEVLPKMGVTDLFDRQACDLTGISKSKDLNVDQIVHKTVLEVDEQGSEAAATTTVRIQARSLNSRPSFVADHPFLWAIRHRQSELLIFMGRLSRPEGPLLDHDEF
uniref:Leukocyte elastase inhibitor-like n=1 Tax=Ciona intestinalis TaxID=7719 RepID=F6VTS4_CIOIN|nr:leukocyte elastase inhibitor-like isoform X1 [Ciona intestinalis]|eukprot:XP_002130997.1 leukocyte elastase inhibitor-like isoform X1 [Ciona intestinalis]